MDAVGIGVAVDFRQLPAVLALGPAQQAVQVGQGPRPRGGCAQGRRQAVGHLRPMGRPGGHRGRVHGVGSRNRGRDGDGGHGMTPGTGRTPDHHTPYLPL